MLCETAKKLVTNTRAGEVERPHNSQKTALITFNIRGIKTAAQKFTFEITNMIKNNDLVIFVETHLKSDDTVKEISGYIFYQSATYAIKWRGNSNLRQKLLCMGKIDVESEEILCVRMKNPSYTQSFLLVYIYLQKTRRSWLIRRVFGQPLKTPCEEPVKVIFWLSAKVSTLELVLYDQCSILRIMSWKLGLSNESSQSFVQSSRNFFVCVMNSGAELCGSQKSADGRFLSFFCFF